MAAFRAASAQAFEQYACLPLTGNFLPHRWQGLVALPVNTASSAGSVGSTASRKYLHRPLVLKVYEV